jgi:predicted Fe-Mo cluster-binding NifX family protein
MKVAISAEGPSLDSRIDPRFGRCPFLLVVDTETLEWEAVENAARAASGGAGIRTAELLADRAISHVLTGRCGPNAQTALAAAGIRIIEGCEGTAREAISRFSAGEFTASSRPEAASPARPIRPTPQTGAADSVRPGGGPGRGTGRGVGGGGRGMGGGGGRGMGGGSGRGRGAGRGLGGGRGMGRGGGRA